MVDTTQSPSHALIGEGRTLTVALAWLVTKSAVSAIATKVSHLDDLAAAAALRLTAAELAALDEASRSG